jgi:hypothetical protein
MNEDLPFVCAESSGVPILLCPAEIAEYWEGINEPRNGRIIEADFYLNSPHGTHVDYDRACDAANEYVSTIQIGSGKALIFGEEIPTMYWIASDAFNGGYALTWLFLPEKEKRDNLSYKELVKSLPEKFFSDTKQLVTCSDKGFLLFPSTHAPIDGDYFEYVEINCPAGIYGASLGFHETPDTSIRIIKIQHQDS